MRAEPSAVTRPRCTPREETRGRSPQSDGHPGVTRARAGPCSSGSARAGRRRRLHAAAQHASRAPWPQTRTRGPAIGSPARVRGRRPRAGRATASEKRGPRRASLPRRARRTRAVRPRAVATRTAEERACATTAVVSSHARTASRAGSRQPRSGGDVARPGPRNLDEEPGSARRRGGAERLARQRGEIRSSARSLLTRREHADELTVGDLIPRCDAQLRSRRRRGGRHDLVLHLHRLDDADGSPHGDRRLDGHGQRRGRCPASGS